MNDDESADMNVWTSARGDRQVDLADVEHRVAEREHLVAFDARDGAGAGGADVAADELDGDRAAVLEPRRAAGVAAAGAAGLQRHDVERLEARCSARRTRRRRSRRATAAPTRARGAARRLRAARRQRQAREQRRALARFVRRAAMTSSRRGAAIARLVAPPRRPASRSAAAQRPLELGHHRLDRRDAGDRILGEVPAVAERAGEASFDIDRRARHAGDDARVDAGADRPTGRG